MAGDITETGELYSPYIGLVYMFNLIVGTGALTMPKAFAMAGWLVSLILIMLLGFMSYMTTTFVTEAMAAANAQLRWKRREKELGTRMSSELKLQSSIVCLPVYSKCEKLITASVESREDCNHPYQHLQMSPRRTE